MNVFVELWHLVQFLKQFFCDTIKHTYLKRFLINISYLFFFHSFYNIIIFTSFRKKVNSLVTDFFFNIHVKYVYIILQLKSRFSRHRAFINENIFIKKKIHSIIYFSQSINARVVNEIFVDKSKSFSLHICHDLG